MSGDVDLPIQNSLNEHCISVLDKGLTPVRRMVVSLAYPAHAVDMMLGETGEKL